MICVPTYRSHSTVTSYCVVILHKTAIRAHVNYYSITVTIGSRVHNLLDNYVKITDDFRETKKIYIYIYK